jgi:hypothetical protein
MRTIYAMMAGLVIVVGIRMVAFAADCELPAFLAIGKTYLVLSLGEITVMEIDQKTCWIKVTLKEPTFAGPKKKR